MKALNENLIEITKSPIMLDVMWYCIAMKLIRNEKDLPSCKGLKKKYYDFFE